MSRIENKTFVMPPRAADVELNPLQQQRVEDGSKLDLIRFQGRGKPVAATNAKLIAALAGMRSFDGLFKTVPKNAFLKALVNPENESVEAVTIATRLYIEHLDLGPAKPSNPKPVEDKAFVMPPRAADVELTPLQQNRVEDGSKMDMIRFQGRGKPAEATKAKLIAALAGMRSFDDLFKTVPKNAFLEALVKPENESVEAVTVATRLYIEHLDLGPAKPSNPRPTEPALPPTQPAGPKPPTGPIPQTVSELVAYAEGNPPGAELPGMLMALDQGPLGPQLRSVSQQLRSIMADANDLESQKQFGQEVEKLLQEARTELGSGKDVETAIANVAAKPSLGSSLAKLLSDATQIDVFWAAAKLANNFIATMPS